MRTVNYFLLTVISFMLYTKLQAQNCDTVNYRTAITSWSDTSYQAPSTFPGFYGGYINGVNFTGDLQKANYFDLSATTYTYLQGAWIKFDKANSTKSANLSNIVYFKIYSDNNGVPGTLLATSQKTLADIKTDVDAKKMTNITFSGPVALPASKKFYVSVDISNFKWSLGGTLRDSLYIGGTKNNEVLPNTAWELENDSSWVAFPNNWTDAQNNPLNIRLWIFPYVSLTSAACNALPVTLVSFTGERNANDVVLKWKVAEEFNMKGYEVEKSNNNNMFAPVAFVPAHNDLKAENYTITDANAFANNTTLQYRLKQIDADGSIKYSNIVAVKYNHSNISFANPFAEVLNLRVNIQTPQTIAVNLYDIQGKLVATQSPVLYNTSAQIILNRTIALKAGTYLLKVIVGSETFTYKVVKQ